MLAYACLISILSLVVFIGVKIKSYYPTATNFPGPDPSWLKYPLGAIGEFAKYDITQAHQRFVELYGKVCSYRILFRGQTLVADADMLTEILSDNTKVFYNRPDPVNKIVLGSGLLVSRDEVWKAHRRLLQPAFSASNIKTFTSDFDRHADTMVQRWNQMVSGKQDGTVIDVHKELGSLTIEIIGATAFGMDISENQTLRSTIDDLLQTSGLRNVIPYWVYLPFPWHLKLLKQVKYLTDFVRGIVQTRRSSKEEKPDLLQSLVNARSSDERQLPLSAQEIKDETMTFLLAGSETTSNLVTWALYAMEKYPEVKQKVIEEIDREFETGDSLTEIAPRLEYMGKMFSEVLRLYPPATVLIRECGEDTTVKGHRFPKGNAVVVPIYALHRQPEYWPDPEKFDPHRFDVVPKPCTYLPFGKGGHVCIGKSFALMEARIILASLYRNFEFKNDPSFTLEHVGSFLYRPKNGLKMIVSRRQL